MVRLGRVLLKDAGNVIDKDPLRDSGLPSLQATLEIKDGIPCLVPKDGKILGDEGL